MERSYNCLPFWLAIVILVFMFSAELDFKNTVIFGVLAIMNLLSAVEYSINSNISLLNKDNK